MIKLIYARSSNGVIGIGNKLPWYLPSELEIFKNKTTNHIVAMGRKTFDSLPKSVKPLTSRENVVFTRSKDFSYPGVLVSDSVDKFLIDYTISCFKIDPCKKDLWIIGGVEIFKAAEKFASEIHITNIHKEFDGDVFEPQLDLTNYNLDDSSDMVFKDSKTNIEFNILVYRKRYYKG